MKESHQIHVSFWQSLGFRILVGLSFILALGLGGSWYFTIQLTKEEFLDITHERFHDRFSDINTSLQTLGEVSQLWAKNHAYNLQQEIHGVHSETELEGLRSIANADVLIYCDVDGIVQHSTKDFVAVQDDLTSWEIVQTALKKQETDLFITSAYNQFFLFASAPVFTKNKKLSGVLLLGFGLNQALLENLQEARHENLAFVRQRAVMASTFQGHNSDPLRTLPINYLRYQNLLDDQIIFQEITLHGETYLVDGLRLPLMQQGLDGSILIAIPVDTINARVARLNHQFSLLFTFCFALLAVLIAAMTRKQLHPIVQLISMTNEVAAGKLDLRIPVHGKDEFAVLGNHFNLMVESLSQANEELSTYHAGLEKLIFARTAQLEETNKSLGLTNAYLEEAQTIAAMGNWIYDPASKKLEISRSLALMLGLEVQDSNSVALDLAEYLAMVDPADLEVATKLFQDSIVKSDQVFEYLIHPKAGYPIILFSKARPFQKDGELKVVGTALDITERKLREKKINFAREEAEGANEVKDKMLALIVHDLKGPLGSVQAALKMLHEDLDHKLGEDEIELFDVCDQTLDRIQKMIADLLQLHKIRGGQMRIESEWINLYDIVEMLLEQLSPLISGKKLIFMNQLQSQTSLFVDPNLITQVFQNLITNAIKFSNLGGEVVIEQGEEKDSFVVGDHGVGMTAIQLEKIFSSEDSTSTPGTMGEQGTGVGMPLCQEVMRAHGGRIGVQSVQHEGSQFTLYFRQESKETPEER